MEIEGTTAPPVAPPSPPPADFRSDSTGAGRISSLEDNMDSNHVGGDMGAPIYSNESSAMSGTTEPQAQTDHSTTSHSVEHHYAEETHAVHQDATPAYGLASGSSNATSAHNEPSAPTDASSHPSLIPSTSVLSHMPAMSSQPMANSGVSISSAPSMAPMPSSGTASLSSSSALATSIGGTMLSTGIGKKIKILAKKPDPVAIAPPVPSMAMSTMPHMAHSTEVDIMGPHSYQMDVEDGTGASGMMNSGAMDYGYGGTMYGGAAAYDPYTGLAYDPMHGGMASGGVRKRKSEYDLVSSTDVLSPATKKRAAKASGRGRSSAIDGAYSPAGSHKQRGGAGGTPRGPKSGTRGANTSSPSYASTPGASNRRMPPIGAVSSRRDLEGTPMSVCYDAVVELMERKEAPAFNQPVDPEALGIPNYFSIIKRPMDLRTVKDKVKRNLYMNAASFVDDVRLIWHNATLFNSADTPVHQMAQSMAMFFESCVPDIVARANMLDPSGGHGDPQLWAAQLAAAQGTFATPGGRGASPLTASGNLSRSSAAYHGASTPQHHAHHTPGGGARGGPKSAPSSSNRPVRAAAVHDPKKTALEERLKQLNQQVKSAETQLNNLKKNGYNQALNRAIDALASRPPPRSFEVSDVSALPFPLKASLAHILRTMTDVNHVREITKIMMQEHFSFPRQGSEVYVHIDDMTPIMLRRIEHYIKNNYPDGTTLLETPAPEPSEEENERSTQAAAAVANNARQARASALGPTSGTAAASTDESMLVDVMGVDSTLSNVPAIIPPPEVPAASSIASNTSSVSSNARSSATSAAPARANSHHAAPKSASKHQHAILDDSDSDTSDSDSDDDVGNSNVLLRTSTRVDIVPVVPREEEVVEIKNAQSWSAFETAGGSSGPSTTHSTPHRPTTPGSAITSPGGLGDGAQGDENSSSAPSGESWNAFRNLDAQNKQRDRERTELEEKQKREKEEREKEARAEEERKRKAAEEAANKAAEEEKAKREAEIKALREAERAKREASAAEAGVNMMEQSSIMRSLEKDIRSNSTAVPPTSTNVTNANVADTAEKNLAATAASEKMEVENAASETSAPSASAPSDDAPNTSQTESSEHKNVVSSENTAMNVDTEPSEAIKNVDEATPAEVAPAAQESANDSA